MHGGSIGGPHIGDLGVTGRYWSSSAAGSDYSYYLFLGGSVQVAPMNNQRNAYSLRCLSTAVDI